MDLSFNCSASIERFILCAQHRLNLLKHLSLFIPSFVDREIQIWKGFFVAVCQKSSVISLSIMTRPQGGAAPLELQEAAGKLLSIPSLKYVTVSTAMVPAIIAVQCPALRELEVRAPTVWHPTELAKYAQEERPKLNTIFMGAADISPSIMERLFDLSSLKRLAVIHVGQIAFPHGLPMFQLLEMTSSTLEEFSIWVDGSMEQRYIAELKKLRFPNLRAFTLCSSPENGIDQSWKTCDDLVSTLVAISGKELKELRLYFHNCDPLKITRKNKLSVPHIHPQITAISLYCWSVASAPAPRKVLTAEAVLQERLGAGRTFRVFWFMPWSSLTHFGVPQPPDQIRI
ncbi:hypothetical protein DL96DRAFT_1609788 [Flagelloscypha sp. PMI_526]|nr:hypothetical protein DL96DRAFT_1609788 [Flagelloscypha sp. PMI_526]